MQASMSKITIASLVFAASAFAGAANAQKPDRLTDVAFIAANRCEGLAQGAKVDVAGIKKMLDFQGNQRGQYILEKADEARDDAKRQASRADGYTWQTVSAELNGACQAYLKS
ncbi:MAG TPA: hypothetical protein VHY32_00780 [Caulobacteraceae bacterium]|jgi:hypothetical protein|nr:hypothetical protein [Caulobacteraceae bacterium]